MRKLLLITSILALAVACEKEPDSPPENLLNQSKAVTVDSLRQMQAAVSPNGVSITDSLHVYGIITMDESEGNLYKNLYLQDHTAGIQMRLSAGSDFAVGDSVRVSLHGAYLSEYAGTIQLDSIDPDAMIIKQSAGNYMAPTVKTISEVTLADEGMLIRIDNVQFTAVELTETYSDAINQASENRILEDCDGNTIIVRTSGFASYANQIVKQGNGSIVAIVGRYNTDIQLLIRSLPELTLDNERCAGQLINKNFDDDDINSGGWITVQVSGPGVNWTTSMAGGASTPYAVISNWNGSSNDACENWLISPGMDLSSSTGAVLNFNNAYNYAGDALAVLVSSDYSGSGDPSLATWTDITSSATWSSGGWAWANSGDIDLSAYTGTSVYVAFKYVGSASDGSTWELDDIIVTG
ncbi:DUF5689 domain-containing protein [Paracrocinitomix mangrovi]|uniref:DUF5689 domain-containing protein n=1 Tax=Paracrocinitomix mangrovi TaxID=2862509 RepID=UPI001C8E66D7|nr:DUF5689 domain-containing protein [Paracrocinitomix mangrovi]UKN02095.1 DUF5689 domain-containing protein [Paracrocinitomix mangrovi]